MFYEINGKNDTAKKVSVNRINQWQDLSHMKSIGVALLDIEVSLRAKKIAEKKKKCE